MQKFYGASCIHSLTCVKRVYCIYICLLFVPGHIYAIGECGGAMEESQCPDCGSAIGGTQHRLLQGNAVATEMDGAQRGAWSDEANMDMALARRLQFEIRDRLF